MKVFESYSMDYSSRRESAQRDDGVWFTRHQYRDPRFGYKWSKWERSGPPRRLEELASEERRVRLPKS